MKLGISSYTFGWAVGVKGHEPPRPMSEIDLVDFAAAQSVRVLQVGDNLSLDAFDAERLDQFVDFAKARQIQIEVGGRGLSPERVCNFAGIARKVGARLIRFIIDNADFHPDAKSVTSILREIDPMLEGLVLAVENHDRFAAKTLRKMIEAAGSNRIGVCLDTANSLGSGEGIEAVAEILAPITVNLHIKDFQIRRVSYLMGFNVIGCPAGSGMLKMPQLLETLAPYKRCENAILELWTPPEETLAETIAKERRWAMQSLEYLRPFFS